MVLLPSRAKLACARGTRGVDRYRICHQCVHTYRSVRLPVVLYTTANVFVEIFDENTHDFIFVEDVSALQRTLGQLVDVLLDSIAVLAQAADGLMGLVDCVLRGVRTKEIVDRLSVQRYLRVLGTLALAGILWTA